MIVILNVKTFSITNCLTIISCKSGVSKITLIYWSSFNNFLTKCLALLKEHTIKNQKHETKPN